MSTKGCVGLFLFCLVLDLFAKIKKYLGSTHSHKPVLLITRYKQNRINPMHRFVDIRKAETCAKLQQKY